MSGSMLDKLTEQLIATGNINAEDRELYTYGLHQGLMIIINIITTLIIGYIFSLIWHSVLFMIAYLPLRSFAGGYHAKTQLRCYIYSILLTTSVLLTIKYVQWTSMIILGGAFIAGIIIFVYAPVEDANKPLDDIEVKVYRKRTRIILIVEICVMLLFLICRIYMVPVCISVSLFALAIMILMGKLKKYYEVRQRY